MWDTRLDDEVVCCVRAKRVEEEKRDFVLLDSFSTFGGNPCVSVWTHGPR